MSNDKRRRFLTAIVAVLALTCLSGVATQSVTAKGDTTEIRTEGRLVAKNVTARTVSIRVQSGAVKSFTIPTSAKVERNGRRVGLAAFKIGDRAQVRQDATTLVVTKFEATGP